MVPLYILRILILFSFASAWSQDSTLVSIDTIKMRRSDMLKYDGLSILGGIKQTCTAPLRWEKDDWLGFGGVVVGTGLLWIADENVQDYFIEQGAAVPEIVKDGGFYFGKPLYNYGITAAIYGVGIITKNSKIRKTGVLIISSATAGGVLQTILKNGVGRARPSSGLSSATFKPFSKEESFHSFPSGHAILSFTTAYAISKQFKSPWIKSGICLVGLVTPLSRLWAGAHWLSDVGMGMAISVATVECIDKYLNRERNYDPIASKKKISWNMQFTSKTIGIVGVY